MSIETIDPFIYWKSQTISCLQTRKIDSVVFEKTYQNLHINLSTVWMVGLLSQNVQQGEGRDKETGWYSLTTLQFICLCCGWKHRKVHFRQKKRQSNHSQSMFKIQLPTSTNNLLSLIFGNTLVISKIIGKLRENHWFVAPVSFPLCFHEDSFPPRITQDTSLMLQDGKSQVIQAQSGGAKMKKAVQ